MDVKRENNSWYKFDIFDDYISWNFEYLWMNWPKRFPDIMFIYKKLEEDDEYFYPGAPANQKKKKRIIINFYIVEKKK